MVNVGLELISGSPTAQEAPFEEPGGHATGRAAAAPIAARRMAINFISDEDHCRLAISIYTVSYTHLTLPTILLV